MMAQAITIHLWLIVLAALVIFGGGFLLGFSFCSALCGDYPQMRKKAGAQKHNGQ